MNQSTRNCRQYFIWQLDVGVFQNTTAKYLYCKVMKKQWLQLFCIDCNIKAMASNGEMALKCHAIEL
jgi:hypothetical protein